MIVYLDNGATSYPKPKVVIDTIIEALHHGSGSLHRSQSREALNLERSIYDARALIADFFNFGAIDHVVFTKNITESINVVLNGFLRDGDHVVTTTLEHNAVIRPLEYLKSNKNITYSVVPLDMEGQLDYDTLRTKLKARPKLMIATHASNVSGDIVDIGRIGALCAEFDVPFLVDTAQSAGVIDVDFKASGATFMAFTGHKSLLGPQGIGGLLIKPGYSGQIAPFILGGTGSVSESPQQPEMMPDKFESGTQNTPGILGLKAGIEYIRSVGLESIQEKETGLIRKFQSAFENDSRVRIIGNSDPSKRVGILAMDFLTMDNSTVVHELSKSYDISTRGGLHCAPLAHKAYGTYPRGTVRFSVSHFTNDAEISYAIEAIKKILHQ
jgi:cysteine desulfurase family protein